MRIALQPATSAKAAHANMNRARRTSISFIRAAR
jgi:hypothetical protein